MLFAAALLAALAAVPDTTPARSDAYLDPGARELVQQARARHNAVEGGLGRYQALAKSRITLGMNALRRDRIFYRCESASRIDWRRGEPARVELLGAREVAPMFSGKVQLGDDDCGRTVFDPMDDPLGLNGIIRLSGGRRGLRHPLSAGSEEDYRFRSGGTTTLRLPDGQTIRLHELQIIPRQSDPRLFSGSLWLEGDTRAVVRAVLRLARPIDFVRDRVELGDDDEDEGDEDIPRFLQPLRGELNYLTVEYALQDGRWWLPRLVALEGEGRAANFIKALLRVEQSYGEYEVEALPPGIAPPTREALKADSTCTRSITISVGGKPAADSTATKKAMVSCSCSNGRCFKVQTVVNRDTAQLINSEYLSPSIYSEGETVVSEAEMNRLIEQVKAIAPTPWSLVRPTFRFPWQGLDLLRYNRVEGLSLGARADVDLGRLRADATLRLGMASLEPSVELGVTRPRPTHEQRLALFGRVEDVSGRGLALGNSLSALLLGRDEGDYYRALGAELIGRPAAGGDGFAWRLFAERQLPMGVATDFNLAGWIGSGTFRENIRADRASQLGAALSWRATRGLDPVGWRGGAAATLEASTGSFSFARPSLTLAGTVPLPVGLLGSLTVGSGTSLGAVPTQSLWYLGGSSTVRGYGGNAARGEAFWRGRAEIATTAPGARLVLFSDAGWAGEREAYQLDPQLLSAGVGASFLDGLFRIDLARALRNGSGWRLDLHLDAPL